VAPGRLQFVRELLGHRLKTGTPERKAALFDIITQYETQLNDSTGGCVKP
jgi:hypothetical protein